MIFTVRLSSRTCRTLSTSGSKPIVSRDPWTDLYPPENILAGYSQGPLIVDVGGNLGEDLELFRRKYPAHGQQLILQDLPDKVARATCSAEVQRMAHNFFTAQPTLARGARVYHLHSIIHDWDDSDAGRILGHIRDAMIPGYSKLLINDVIIPVRQPSRRAHVRGCAHDGEAGWQGEDGRHAAWRS